ncbi:cholesterol esterase [Actinoplanes lobatus]|uniref:Cholesterol esterase n=1 Tax=Actinoplanes lobatus TaxID=113568 RepID=A0A7W7HPE9_9ACTN|nr:DUF6230 family protein [Actinoplanes lobatus]MBB4754124.1 hypothetical protein [Actinoplanes lobatus]GGN76998.1 cholesterol esterase [Actinoplanes lobatus]GIE40821.1 cholesterol esterase [Actinoplanes lobatus]
MNADEGRTSWGRACWLLLPSLAVLGGLTVGIAEGALAASFGVSGQYIKVRAGSVEGTDVAAYLDTVQSVDGTHHPVMLAGVGRASMRDVCTSAVVDVPVVGKISLKVLGGTTEAITGTNVVADADSLLGGGGVVTDVEAGRDASTLDRVPGVSGPAGRFGLQAGSLRTEDVRSTAWSANGATIELAGDLEVNVTSGVDECF